MRHFLRLALTPGALPRGVRIRSAVAALVAFPGAAQRLAPADLRAPRRAVLIAAVATTADTYLLCAARAVVQPIGLFACRHAPTLHWTTPRIAGIKARRTRLTRARACRRPGVLPRMCPGLRLFSVRDQHSAHRPPSYAGPALRSHRERRLDVRRRCVQPDAVAEHVRISPETPCARKQRGEQFRGRCALTIRMTRVYNPIHRWFPQGRWPSGRDR